MLVQSLRSARDRQGGGDARRKLQQLRELRPRADRAGAQSAPGRGAPAGAPGGRARAGRVGPALALAILLLALGAPAAAARNDGEAGAHSDGGKHGGERAEHGRSERRGHDGGGKRSGREKRGRKEKSRGGETRSHDGSHRRAHRSNKDSHRRGHRSDDGSQGGGHRSGQRSGGGREWVQHRSDDTAGGSGAGADGHAGEVAVGFRARSLRNGSAPSRRVETPPHAVTGSPFGRAASLRGASHRTGSPVTAGGGSPLEAWRPLAFPAAGSGASVDERRSSRPEPARHAKRDRRARPRSFLALDPLISPISRVVEVVPLEMWIALGALAMLSLLSMAVAGGATAWARRARHLARRAEREAETDPLTGLLNRRGLEIRLAGELERARRYGRPVSIAYVDVVGLKSVNDGHGHGSGDAVLANVASALLAGSRDGDLVARVGGDEFAVALVEQDRAGAERFGERLRTRARVARAELGLVSPWDVTVGVAAFPADGEACNDLLAAADRRLYEQRGIEIAIEGTASGARRARERVGAPA